MEYIDSFSIAEVTTNNIRIDIYDVDTTMVAVVRTRLAELGIKNFKINTF
jgi:hypothetical protein